MTGKRKRYDALDIISFVILTLCTIIIVVPFYTAAVTSLLTATSYGANPVQFFPKEITFSNYEYILTSSNLLTGYKNTLIITGLGTVIGLTVSVMMAFGLAYRDYPGKKLFVVYMLITMYFGGGLLPKYLLMKNLHLINSRWSIILMSGVSAFNIIVMKNNIEQLPDGILEAARVDGANEFQVFFQIVLPLIKATLATFTLFIAVGYWNEWYWSGLMLNKTPLKTLQLVLRSIIDQGSENENVSASAAALNNTFSQGVKMAAVFATMLPIMLFYPFLQKHFAKGMLVGAIKM